MVLSNYVFLLIVVLTIKTTQCLTADQLQDILQNQKNSYFVHLNLIYDGSAQSASFILDHFSKIAKKHQDYFKIHLIDCNTEDEQIIKIYPYCAKDNRRKLPLLTVSQPRLNYVNHRTGITDQAAGLKFYQGAITEKNLFDYAEPLMPIYSTQISKISEWNKLKQTNKNIPKVIYFTNKNTIPKFYKALTATFRNKIFFIHIRNSSMLCQKMNITKFPTLSLNGQSTIELSSNLHEQIGILSEIANKQNEQEINIPKSKNKIIELTENNIQELVYNKSKHILVHVSDDDGNECAEWRNLQEQFKGLFDYYETTSLKQKLGVKYTPAILYFPKSIAKKHVLKTIFYAKESFENIKKQIYQAIEDFTATLVDGEDLQKSIGMPIREGRKVAIYFHNDEIPLSYKVISNQQHFSKNITFYRMKNPDEKVIKQYAQNKVPSLIVIGSNQTAEDYKKKKDQEKDKIDLRILMYQGNFNYQSLQVFFNAFVESKKQERVIRKQKLQIQQINNQKQFKSYSSKDLYILLLKGSEEEKQKNQNILEIIKKAGTNIKDKIVSIDGVCHSEILENLGIQQDELPTFIHVNQQMKLFARMVGRIDQKPITKFVAKVRTNKIAWTQYNKLKFTDKDCAQEYEKLKKYQQSYSMSAEQAEILEEIKEQAQKKRKQEVQATKNDKKRKKRRPKTAQKERDYEDTSDL